MSRDRKGGERTDSGWHAFEPNNLAALAVLAAETSWAGGSLKPLASYSCSWIAGTVQRVSATPALWFDCHSGRVLPVKHHIIRLHAAQPLRPDDDWLCIHRDEADDISIDKEGYDKHGYDRNGYDKDGYDK